MYAEFALGVASPIILVVVLFGCLSCLFKKKGFQSYRTGQAQNNPAFAVDVSDVSNTLERVTIEPLPDILSKTSTAICFRPKITCKGQQEALLPLNTLQRHFPRDHLTYLKEMGAGWFGQVIESEASHIVDGSSKTKVVVKMLREDATKMEQKHFMEEVSVFRCLDHVNLLSFLGQCTDTLPFLVILEYSSLGNLKTHLISQRQSAEKLIKKNRLMTFALDVAAGLACLHRHDYVHSDLASRNCLVMANHTVKIGDYGVSDTLFKDEYYNTGRALLPIRWMSPESLIMAEGIWTSNLEDKEADIWSFGVLLWEIFTFGELPYYHLSDDDVLQNVVISRLLVPSKEDLKVPLVDNIWSVMVQCFQNPGQRPDIELLHQNIEHILKADTIASITEFEHKWDKLVPNRPELGSKTALAGSFLADDLSPLSDDSYMLNGDSPAAFNYMADTNGNIRNSFETLPSIPAELIFEDETQPTSADVASAQTLSSNSTFTATLTFDAFSNGLMGEGDGDRLTKSQFTTTQLSVLVDSKTKLLPNEGNNILSLEISNKEMTEENTSPKYSSGEFTDFQSAIEETNLQSVVAETYHEPEVLNASKEFSDFVSSFSEDGNVSLTDSDFFSQEKIEQTGTASVDSNLALEEKQENSGDFTDFVTSLVPTSMEISHLDNVSSSLPEESVDLMINNIVEKSLNSLPDVTNLKSTFEPEIIVADNRTSLPSDFSFMDLLSDGLVTSEQPIVVQEQLAFDGTKIEQDKQHLENAPPLSEAVDQQAIDDEKEPDSDKVGSHPPVRYSTASLSNGFTSADDLLCVSTPVVTNNSHEKSLTVKDNLNPNDQEDCQTDNWSEARLNGDDIPENVTDDVSEDSDTEVSTNSSSGQEYICSVDGTSSPEPSPQVFGVQPDLDEKTLQIVSEIYLSRGVKSPRIFEIPPLETILESPPMSVAEEDDEDVAANQDRFVDLGSDSSSLDIKYDEHFGDDFEWDDLMNSDSPVHQHKLMPSKEQSFSDWALDFDTDPWQPHSSLANGRLSDSNFLSLNKKNLSHLPSSWPSVACLDQSSLYSLMDVTSPLEDNMDDTEGNPSSQSPVSNHSYTPCGAPSLSLQNSHFLFSNETFESSHHHNKQLTDVLKHDLETSTKEEYGLDHSPTGQIDHQSHHSSESNSGL